MSRRIYLLDDQQQLRELVEQPFDSEDALQALLADHPHLLAGDQMDETHPRRWLLVCREAGVADSADGGNRWSLDHLFLDQDGVPTLVEVKRSSDTRLRREVLGQMLDYAANGPAYWSVEKVRALYEAECERRELDPERRLAEVLGDREPDSDAYWQRVKTNLRAGRIRMVFVADEIPPELQRIVEFLNEQMDPAEVLALAVRQYVGGGLRTLVPEVVGRTAEAKARKDGGSTPGPQWNEASFFAALREYKGEEAVEGGRRVYRWARQHLPRMTWGKGRRWGSCIPVRDLNGKQYYPITLWTYGSLDISFHYIARTPPFDDEALRKEMLDRLNRVPGIALPPDSFNRMPTVPLERLASDETWEGLRGVLGWYLERVGAGPVSEEGAG